MSRLLSAAALLAAAAAPTAAAAGDPEITALLERHGIRAVPPAPAADFSVPRIDGGTLLLSEARGRWVVLTFFATWCGPCAAEMPSLQRLHQARHERGVAVLGVAIDGDVPAVKAFAARHRLGFTVGVDTAGNAARLYHAGSVPVSYVLDPAGRVVGMARGARDWGATVALFDDLLALAPAATGAAPLPDADSEPVELPPALVPPSASVRLAGDSPRPGELFALEVRIRWAGNFEDYLLHPPAVHLPDAVHERRTSASTSTEEGDRVVTYTIQLEAGEPGTFALDPVELRYTPRGEAEPVSARISGPTVHVRAPAILGLSPLLFAGLAMAAVVTAAAGVWLWLRRRRRSRGRPRASGTAGTRARIEAALDSARRLRVEGDAAGSFLALATLEQELGATEADAIPDLDRQIERVRYGGAVPPPEQIDSIQRRVERRLAELAPDARAALRDSIRFADSTEDP